MKVSLLAFGIAKEITGSRSHNRELKEGETVGELRALLELEYPRLKELRSYMLAVNSEYANGTEVLKEGDEIAIIPPVSGG